MKKGNSFLSFFLSSWLCLKARMDRYLVTEEEEEEEEEKSKEFRRKNRLDYIPNNYMDTDRSTYVRTYVRTHRYTGTKAR